MELNVERNADVVSYATSYILYVMQLKNNALQYYWSRCLLL